MIGYVFIALAAFFNACMDAWENEPNFNESIFRHWNQRFWLKEISWQYARKIFSYKIDAWHLAKSLMVICFAIALCFDYRGAWYIIVINCGVVWNFSFWLYYHKIFKIK